MSASTEEGKEKNLQQQTVVPEAFRAKKMQKKHLKRKTAEEEAHLHCVWGASFMPRETNVQQLLLLRLRRPVRRRPRGEGNRQTNGISILRLSFPPPQQSPSFLGTDSRNRARRGGGQRSRKKEEGEERKRGNKRFLVSAYLKTRF